MVRNRERSLTIRTQCCFTGHLGPLQLCYQHERKLDAIKVHALHSYQKYLEPEYRQFYPPADPAELNKCLDVQKKKRNARRTQIVSCSDSNLNALIHQLALEELKDENEAMHNE